MGLSSFDSVRTFKIAFPSKMITFKNLAYLLLLIVSAKLSCLAQVASKQSWNDFVVNYSFANSFNFENLLTYNTKIDAPRWYEFNYGPALQLSLTQHFDISTRMTISYVQQNDTANTLELRPALSSAYYITPNKRIQSFLFLSIEQRNFHNLEVKNWETSVRLRVKGAIIIPINRSSYYDDKQWYAMLDTEWFWPMGKDVGERYANRLRIRAGIGYRLNYRWRFEMIYLQQRSKNNIGEDFYTSDHILQLRIKHFIARIKPKQQEQTPTSP